MVLFFARVERNRRVAATVRSVVTLLSMGALHGCVDGPDDDHVSRPIAPLPLVQLRGNAVLSNPGVALVSFTDSTFVAEASALAAALPGSTYWAATTSEYGVHDLRPPVSIALAEPAPASTTLEDIDAWLRQRLADDEQFKSLPPETIVTILYPPTSTITSLHNGTSCVGWGGIHLSTKGPSGSDVPFAVIADCRSPSVTETLAVQNRTTSCAHEWIEAATDPTQMGYVGLAPEDVAWARPTLTNEPPPSEVTDFCEDDGTVDLPGAAGETLVAPRSWSNARARDGADPCVPAGNVAFRGARAVVGDPISILFPSGDTGLSMGTQLDGDGHGELELVFFGDTSDGPVTADLFDADLTATEHQPALAFEPSTVSGRAGERVRVKVSRLRDVPFGTAMFWVITRESHLVTWKGFVRY